MKACPLLRWLTVAVLLLASMQPARAANHKVRVLFVGGDWKAQLPNYQGKIPLRGFFVRQEVDRAAPGRFEFTLWTSYEFLQYGEADSLKKFDVIVAGDVMGQSVRPRLVKGLTAFVENGGGFLYCDNHKAFSFNTRALSFAPVLPVEVVPFRPYGPEPSQPFCKEQPLTIKIAAAGHPTVRGVDWASAPPLRGAHYGTPRPRATVIATSPGGKEIWVAWEAGKGRAFWAGGLFSNDELSEDFARWPQFGRFYVQLLDWLAEKSTYPQIALSDAVASGTLTVDLSKQGPTVTAAHFGIHGQEDAPGGSYPMTGADLALYRELKLDGSFARTGAPSPGGIVKHGKGGQYDYPDLGRDISAFDWSQFDFKNMDVILKDMERIQAVPIFLAWCPWWGPNWPDANRYTKYFAAAIEHANGTPRTASYRVRVPFFEIMNEPDLHPAAEVLPRFADLFNQAVRSLHARYPGVKFGCGGFYEWSYFQALIDRCGKNLDWLSRHPYGQTGEAIFALQDSYLEHAQAQGVKDLKFIITEWDFWIYGAPAFDYIMMRWKPVIDHADTCVGTLHYRWREYQEGGYVFGIHGEFNQKYGELPPEWPNPGKDRPFTYRYNAFWIMRDCRGPHYPVDLDVAELRASESQRAYAVATCDGKHFNIVIYYGYPGEDPAAGKSYGKLKLHVHSPLPAAVKGRTLVISHADCKNKSAEAPRSLTGDTLDLVLEIPSQSAVSLTVK